MRRYTLAELLVAVGGFSILASLAGVVLGSLGTRCTCGPQSRAQADISKLKCALALFQSDTRTYPAPPGPRDTRAKALRDASPWLYAALVRGGPNAPYAGCWSYYGVLTDRRVLDRSPGPGVVAWRELSASEQERLCGPQASRPSTHGPASAQPLVFLDPWGNPFHYREWDSLPDAVRAKHRPGFSGPYELWSNGPNGVDEGGAGDDVTSWSD